MAPDFSLGKYGIAADASATAMMRSAGLWQLCAGAVLLAGKRGTKFASGFGLLASALTTLMNIPNADTIGREKPSQVFGAAVLALLGKLTLDGRIAPMVASYVHLLIGGLIYLTPVSTAKLYQITSPMSSAGHSLLASYGGLIALIGVYVGGLARGLTQPQAFAALFLSNGLLALKFALSEAKSLGAPIMGPLVWSLVSSVLGGLALK